MLEKAKAGIYSQFEVQRGLPIQMLVKYFTQVGEMWQIAPEIRAMVQFRPLNLLHDFGALGTFDVVFCRNVLIYFDQETKIGVLDRIARQTEADGFLVLGAAETVVGLTDSFKPLPDKRGLYAPNAAATGAVANGGEGAARAFAAGGRWGRDPRASTAVRETKTPPFAAGVRNCPSWEERARRLQETRKTQAGMRASSSVGSRST